MTIKILAKKIADRVLTSLLKLSKVVKLQAMKRR